MEGGCARARCERCERWGRKTEEVEVDEDGWERAGGERCEGKTEEAGEEEDEGGRWRREENRIVCRRRSGCDGECRWRRRVRW